ncbi:hypothetical protein [Diaminobutyricimonas sp. LJ205]|uniref:hypothetical protein n=1 Tax=Diaminobutyricimonas sp. LJ205 TaxID=2683590 RepID=UPI0012F4B656|nr:hypothetical protein [Diaminobutyricimonas sp. LJ205]
MFGYPVGQDEAFAESDAACMKGAGIEEVLAAAPPREEVLLKGHQAVINMRACLVENGWDIPAAPSLQTYVESDGAFTPYEHVPLADFSAAEKVCPQNGF